MLGGFIRRGKREGIDDFEHDGTMGLCDYVF